jgi:hypothetical protein
MNVAGLNCRTGAENFDKKINPTTSDIWDRNMVNT